VHLVSFEPGRIALRLRATAPPDLPQRLGAMLSAWTGESWIVTPSEEPGAPTLGEQKETADNDRSATVTQHPLMARVFEEFPGAKIEEIRDLAPPSPLDGDITEEERIDEKPRPDDETGAGDAGQGGRAPG
jgi:DNA polymerase-3 subunit gamma/tau